MTTLADLTPEERAECVGMWCKSKDGVLFIYMGDHIVRDWMGIFACPKFSGNHVLSLDDLTPNPDLPRAWTPDGQPPAGEWEYAEYLGDYKGMTDVYHFDGEPTHRRWVGSWEQA